MSTKQVIVMRKDLNMRKGKMIAQGAHASLKVILDLLIEVDHKKYELDLTYEGGNRIYEWVNGIFTKICVSVNSEKELIDIYNEAVVSNIPCSLIQDNGITEFNGVPTYTCCAIGPDDREAIDKITGHLPLL